MRCNEIKKMKLNVLLSMFATIKHTYKSKLLSVCFYSHVLQLKIKVQFQFQESFIWRIKFSFTYFISTVGFVSFPKNLLRKEE